jgi:hypothetical protein
MALHTKMTYRSIVVLIVVFAAACSAVNDPKADQSFTTDKPCAAPCWYGLEPDRSTKADVLAVLTQLEFIDSASVQEYSDRWFEDDHALGIAFDCIHPKIAGCVNAIISGDKLKWLRTSAGSKLTVKMTVDKLGIPSYVDYGPYAPEVGGCIVTLAWPPRGISIGMLDTRNDEACRAIRDGHGIPADLRVTSLDYTVQGAFTSDPGGCCKRVLWPGFAKP